MRSRQLVRWLPCSVLATVACMLGACFIVGGDQHDKIRVEPAVTGHQELMENCESCHFDLLEGTPALESRRKSEEQCFQCHESKKNECAWCHADPARAGERPDKDHALIFPHREHLPRVKQDCKRCHLPAYDGDPHPTGNPGHTQCFTCHQMREFFDALRCKSCHKDLVGRLIAPTEKFQHGKDWIARHGEFTRNPVNAETCALCHDDNFCADCHATERQVLASTLSREKVTQAFIHPGDWVHTHMFFARARPESCLTCHSTKTCLDCHQQEGVALPQASKRQDGFQFHGPGLMDPTSPEFHGKAARRDIVLCASCHDNGLDSNCVSCHQVGGIGGNPHPPGFSSPLSRSGAKVCRVCHFPS